MATEAWTLDGVALASGNFTLMALEAPPPKERPDWISAADSEGGALMRQPLHENRTITMKLRVAAQASMDLALDQVAAVVTKLRKASQSPDGIALVWTPANSTRTVTFDVLEGEIPELPISMDGEGRSWIMQRPVFTVVLTCKPYWRGTETLTSTASSSTPFVTLEIPSVTGDAPALGRLIVTDTATQNRRHVEWGLEGPLTYNNALSLLIDSDSLVVTGFSGTQTTKTGAYDPNAAGNTAITASLVPWAAAICGTGNQSHVGVYRVKARVWSDGGTGTSVRFSWQAGDGELTSNPYVSPVATGRWEEIDLGTIVVPVAVLGTQRWTGRVEAFDTVGAAFWIDYLILVPASDGYGKATAVYTFSAGLLAGNDSYTATTAGGALNARVAPVGGTWATSGDATDWLFSDAVAAISTSEMLIRTTAAAGTTGRFGILGTATPTDVMVQTALNPGSVPAATGKQLSLGVIARWTDASNYLRGTITWLYTGSAFVKTLEIKQLVAGTPTVLASVVIPSAALPGTTWYLLRLTVSAAGQAVLTIMTSDGTPVVPVIQGSSTALATAGALASGKSGIFDFTDITTTTVRYYDDFYIFTPPAEPIVVYSGRNMQIRYDDTLRQDSTATYTGRPQSYRGSRFLVPVGTSRVLVKARRNNIELLGDDNVIDATQIQVGWTQRGLAVPR